MPSFADFLRMSPFAFEWQWRAVFLTRLGMDRAGIRQEKQEKQ
jgi:heme exporter protein D